MFGSGRREGVLTVLALMGLVLAIHALGAYTGLADGSEGDRRLCAAMATANQLMERGELPVWDPAGAGAPLGARGAPLF